MQTMRKCDYLFRGRSVIYLTLPQVSGQIPIELGMVNLSNLFTADYNLTTNYVAISVLRLPQLFNQMTDFWED